MADGDGRGGVRRVQPAGCLIADHPRNLPGAASATHDAHIGFMHEGVAVALGSTQDDWSPGFNQITTSIVETTFGLNIYFVFGVMPEPRVHERDDSTHVAAMPGRERTWLTKLWLVGVMNRFRRDSLSECRSMQLSE